MNRENEMSITFDSRSENEGLARVVVAAFMAPMDPTMEELSDVKTAVSEAVTNAIIHGYEGGQGKVTLRGKICHNRIELQVEDQGIGIPDVLYGKMGGPMRGKSHGTPFYHQAGTGPVWHGLCFYGGFYG